jgi:phosphoribosyl 1,2-cyclic phosphodiesterase
MAVEDDPAWKEWNDAFDNLVSANERLILTHHLPNNDPEKRAAWAAVEHAQRLLNQAANKIAPAFKR